MESIFLFSADDLFAVKAQHTTVPAPISIRPITVSKNMIFCFEIEVALLILFVIARISL